MVVGRGERTKYLDSQICTGQDQETFSLNSKTNFVPFHRLYPSFHLSVMIHLNLRNGPRKPNTSVLILFFIIWIHEAVTINLTSTIRIVGGQINVIWYVGRKERTTYLDSLICTDQGQPTLPLNQKTNCVPFHHCYPSFHISDIRCNDLVEDDFSSKTTAEKLNMESMLCSIKCFDT